nr:N-acetylmuramoyl-L-alanine amidase CwlD [Romboutsia sp. D33t1_170424_H2]
MEYSKVFFNINVQGDIVRKYIKHIIFCVISIILVVVFSFEIQSVSQESMEYMPVTKKTIILDAGHGGIDPGALNEDKSITEKDVNLSITLKLRELLESSGGLVILTREEDVSLYEEAKDKTIRQKYNENLKNRKKIINESDADMFVSIHMNALSGKGASKYYGAQTFYPGGKDDSKKLSKYIQEELKRVVDKTNNREIKPKDDLYLLKENAIPSVLIECGFLSNEKEANLLADEKYQEKIAWSIYVGIQKYFSDNENKN